VSGNEKVGFLQQRCIEAKIFKTFLTVLEREFGTEKARSLAASVVRDLAFDQGHEYRQLYPEGNIGALADLWRSFAEGSALDVELIEQSEDCLRFRIKRCGYAEAYREMGLADLGCLLSCDRDEPFLKGFSDKITLDRSRTVMEGGRYCDFVYRVKK
jgi:hypothetical protein